MTLNIAIDGPSGAGKSTIAKLIAKKLGITYLDTGAMYRGLAYYALQNGVQPNDEVGVLPILENVTMDIQYNENGQKVIVNDKDVTPFIREHNISMAASTISKIHAVRLKLASLQREIASKTDCVLDGRDIGSFVLPNANVKIYMDASAEVRAERRKLDLEGKGDFSHTYEEILADIKARDYQDMNRDFAPLKVADGAIIIDTSYMSIDEVAQKVISLCQK